MIATIRRVWPGEKRTSIIAVDTQTGRECLCYVFLPEGQWIAALCEQACWNGKTQPHALVLTVEPKTMWGYKITAAELLPEDREKRPFTANDPIEYAPWKPAEVVGDVQSVADDFERLYGHAGQGLRRRD